VKGKQAARAANRRADTAEAKAEELKGRLASERSDWDIREKSLKEEIGRLKNGLIEEAGRLAAEEISRLNEELIQARRQLSEAEARVEAEAEARDYLMRNMCKYISMTEGVQPSLALGRVITWLTNKPYTQNADVNATLRDLQLPSDGWVAKLLRRGATYLKDRGGETSVPLDYAEEHHEEFPVHPGYQSIWYAKEAAPRLDGGRRGAVTLVPKTQVILRPRSAAQAEEN
jgi:hypothetical protein